MSIAEFESWAEFYRHAPFDDAARYHRPAAVLSSIMAHSKDPISKMQELIAPKWQASPPPPKDSRLDGLSRDDLQILALFGAPGV